MFRTRETLTFITAPGCRATFTTTLDGAGIVLQGGVIRTGEAGADLLAALRGLPLAVHTLHLVGVVNQGVSIRACPAVAVDRG